jgi:hypothetical protein
MDSPRKTGGASAAIDRPDVNCYGRAELRRQMAAGTRPGPRSSTVRRFLAPAACVLALGCGPVEYINQVSNRAASAVSSAKLASAERYAPYEYTAAQEYLHKAREEAGYAQYQDAIEYGHRAEDYANRARAIAIQRMATEAANAHYQPKRQNEEPAPPAAEPAAKTPGTP